MDIRELLRHIQAEPSDRAVQRATGAHRQTVQRYRAWAQTHALLDHPLPPVDQLHRLIDQTLELPPPPQVVSSVEPYRTLVSQLRAQGTEIAAIWHRLKDHGFHGSYAAVYRFVQTIEQRQPDAVVRVERAPGAEAQVDFGAAGRMLDPQTGEFRKAWSFVMTLSWSRHQYVEFVFDQKVGTWLLLHAHAFAFFGGIPQRLVIDNLKAAITRASWDDPQVQQSYRECAEHYGFLIAPCRPRTPEHKGKVEQGGVHYVTRNFLGGRPPTTITQANQDVRAWCLTTAGQRVHGTTREQPLRRFEHTEQATLKPLPPEPYDLALWKVVTLYRDCHVTFDNAYYSAPFRLIGHQLRACGGSRTVRLYTLTYDLVATHTRAQHPGERHTHPDHLPPEKLAGLLLGRPAAQAAAADIGPRTAEVVQRLLDDGVVERLPTVQRLLRLRERWGDATLEAACARALHFGDPTYATIKRVLVEGHATEPVPQVAPVPPAHTFIRSASDLLGHLFGGRSWT